MKKGGILPDISSMRCFMAFLAHESNSFSPIPTGYASFDEIGIYSPDMGDPEDHLPLLKGVADFYLEAQKRGHTAIVGTCALAQPSAPCRQQDYEMLRDAVLGQLQAAMPVDMILLMMHGSMMAQGYDDCEGDILIRIRQIVGKDVPIGLLLDLHCNITPAMLEHATALMPCKEYPHTDFAERAAELYDIIEKTARGQICPVISFYRIPVLGLFQTTESPMRDFVARMIAEEKKQGVLSVSLAHGFPWADFAHTGAGIIVVTDNQPETGQKLASDLGLQFFAMREKAHACPLSIEEALARLDGLPAGTVVMADMADNPGGGAGSDSNFILRALLKRGISNTLLGLFWDPVAVSLAFAAGENSYIPLRIGGKLSRFSGDPLDVDVHVKCLRTDASQPHISDGYPTRLGRTAIVEVNGIEIVFNEIRQQPFHPDAFLSAGTDPWKKRLVVVKSSYHFYAGFATDASAVLYVDTPGTLNNDATDRPYKHIKRPIWPLDDIILAG